MDSILERHSIRKYKTREISQEQIQTIIEAAILAPSAKNRQPWKYLIYSGESKADFLAAMEAGLDRESKEHKLLPKSVGGLPDAYNTLSIMREAPILIAIINTNGNSPFEGIETDNRIAEICDTLSIGASVENMLLRATEIGLGTLWIANTCFAYNDLADYIGEKGQLVGAVAVGYTDEKPISSPRRDISETVVWKS